MYSEYTALFTHSTQRTCTVSYIIYTLYILVVSYTLVLYFIIYRMYVKINVLYVHCTAYILHTLDLARALVFNTAHSTLHKIAFRMNGR